MSLHFTYVDPDTTTLFQGDILRRTPNLDKLLQQFHPYFFQNSNYKYFMVLTQSCDLVRDRSLERLCKAEHITLAAIQPLGKAIQLEMLREQKHQVDIKGRFLAESKKNKLKEFLSSLMNNNNLDYFFLYKHENLEAPHSYVVFLRLCISFRANKHYQDCLDAKFLQLEDNFRAKLGWLTGNIYSRVATKDWPKDDLETIIEAQIEATPFFWVNGDKLSKLREQVTDVDAMTPDDLKAAIERISVPSKNDRLTERLRKIFDENGVDAGLIPEILRQVENDTTIRKLIGQKDPES